MSLVASKGFKNENMLIFYYVLINFQNFFQYRNQGQQQSLTIGCLYPYVVQLLFPSLNLCYHFFAQQVSHGLLCLQELRHQLKTSYVVKEIKCVYLQIFPISTLHLYPLHHSPSPHFSSRTVLSITWGFPLTSHYSRALRRITTL